MISDGADKLYFNPAIVDRNVESHCELIGTYRSVSICGSAQ
jgi:hypothetical protein